MTPLPGSRFSLFALLVLIIPGRPVSAQGNIFTYAGGGGAFTGDGKPAISAQIAGPTDVKVDAKGNVLFVSQPLGMVMQIAPDGTLRVIAGNGLNAFSGDGGPARAAALSRPNGLTLDAAGNILLADAGNNKIRGISPDGTIRTVAGSGSFGSSGDGGPATQATLATPGAVATDAAGNVYITDNNSQRIRMVTPAGVISTVAGNGSAASTGDGGPATAAGIFAPAGIAVDSSGNIYVSEGFARVRKFKVGGTIATFAGSNQSGFSGDGGPAAQARLFFPAGLAFDAAGRLYIADSYNEAVRRVNLDGTIATIAGNGVGAFTGDGGPATSASLSRPTGVAVAGDGTVYIADTENDRIRKISTSGIITTVAGSGLFLGDGGASTDARLDQVADVALDSAGNVYALTTDRRVRKVTPAGTITTFAGSGRAKPENQGDGGLATNAGFQNPPTGIAVDSQGAMYIANNLVIRKVTTDGVISTFTPAVTSNGNRLSVDAASNLYLSVSNPGAQVLKITQAKSITPFAGTNQPGYSGDGGPALSAALSSFLGGTTTGPDGSVYICDAGNNRVRRVDRAGVITTFAGNGTGSDSGDGGPATAAGVPSPQSVVFDAKGNLYIADAGRIRKVAAGGTISTYAGTGRYGFSGDGGTAVAASFETPSGLAVDAQGNLYVADSGNLRVRVIQSGPGPLLLLSQKGLTFRAGGSAATQGLTVVNSGQGTVNWAVSTSVASAGPNWLSATPTSGSSQAGQAGPVVNVKADPTGIPPGDYYGQVVVSSPGVPNSPQSATVVLIVPAAGAGGGSSVQPSGLLFTGTGAADPPAQNLTVTTNTAGGSRFAASVVFGDGRAWFTLQPASGTVQPNAPLIVQVKPSLSGFSAGVYNAAITVAFDDLTTQQVNLLLVVSSGVASSGVGTAKPRSIAAAGCAPGKLLPLFTSIGSGFSATTGWPASLEVRVVDDCGNPLTKGSVIAGFSNNDPALPLNSLLDGRWSGTWQVANAGQATVTVQAQDAGGGLSGSAQVSGGLNANANPPPVVASGGVLDAASYSLGAPVAPGSLVAIFGQYLAQQENSASALPLPNTLGVTQVTIAGRAMPLLFAGASQANAMIPYDLPINAAHQVVAKRGNTISIPEPVSLLSSRSGVFTKDLTGTGPGIVVKVAGDGTQSIVTADNPVSANDAIVIYCDGLGSVDQPVVAGSQTPVTPLTRTLDAVSVTIGSRPAPVFFAGLTPGFTGLYQINAIVPGGVAPGDGVPLVITQAGQASPPVSISVR
jgi:uncharacterized protein (TIGR03437 family)